ncbi:MAG: VanW family protein [Ruminococcus sp.]|nr:VanW family protein [Ruminococcus sp.]
MLWKKDVLFCEINPTCYAISLQKEILKRHIQNLRSKEIFSKTKSSEKLPTVVSTYSCGLIKKGKGIDPVLQQNKAVNIDIACKSINGLIIHPGETFSFWNTVGKTTKSKGYKDGRVIEDNKVKPGIGGGLCNLGNTIHLLVLHSPLTVTEFHNHSDALAPDHGERIPFSTGTSISYNNIDYRFKNTTQQDVQLCLWCENERLYGELRSVSAFPYTYKLVEENHHFKKKNDKYYRLSKIYKETYDCKSEKLLNKELVLDNNSLVMFDYDLIPKELIQE